LQKLPQFTKEQVKVKVDKQNYENQVLNRTNRDGKAYFAVMEAGLRQQKPSMLLASI
jgi:hypothetical protein